MARAAISDDPCGAGRFHPEVDTGHAEETLAWPWSAPGSAGGGVWGETSLGITA